MRSFNLLSFRESPRGIALTLIIASLALSACGPEYDVESVAAGTLVYLQPPIDEHAVDQPCGRVPVGVQAKPVDTKIVTGLKQAVAFYGYHHADLFPPTPPGETPPCQPDDDNTLWVLHVAANKHPALH